MNGEGISDEANARRATLGFHEHEWQEADFAMMVTYPTAGPVDQFALNELALDVCSVCGVLRPRPVRGEVGDD